MNNAEQAKSTTHNPFTGKWEKRWHPLRQEWVVYAAHRNSRPWTTGVIERDTALAPTYDPTCYLCPGNERIHGDHNPDYQGVYIFDNDHPVVGLGAPAIPAHQGGVHKRASATGIARVVCYDPRHNVTLSDVSPAVVANVLTALQAETQRLAAVPEITSVFVFENKGKECGVSNPHPHCQMYATDFVFKTVAMHQQAATDYLAETGNNLFQDILNAELADGSRIIASNAYAVAFIPFFARYAYEIMIMPRMQHDTIMTLTVAELAGLAEVYWQAIRKLDMNAGHTFPYVMSAMQGPVKHEKSDYWFHLHLLPPYRAPGLLKYLGGPESSGGTFMADTMPEDKAAELNRWTPVWQD